MVLSDTRALSYESRRPKPPSWLLPGAGVAVDVGGILWIFTLGFWIFQHLAMHVSEV